MDYNTGELITASPNHLQVEGHQYLAIGLATNIPHLRPAGARHRSGEEATLKGVWTKALLIGLVMPLAILPTRRKRARMLPDRPILRRNSQAIEQGEKASNQKSR